MLQDQNSTYLSDNEFDDEPVTKQPRLSGNFNYTTSNESSLEEVNCPFNLVTRIIINQINLYLKRMTTYEYGEMHQIKAR